MSSEEDEISGWSLRRTTVYSIRIQLRMRRIFLRCAVLGVAVKQRDNAEGIEMTENIAEHLI